MALRNRKRACRPFCPCVLNASAWKLRKKKFSRKPTRLRLPPNESSKTPCGENGSLQKKRRLRKNGNPLNPKHPTFDVRSAWEINGFSRRMTIAGQWLKWANLAHVRTIRSYWDSIWIFRLRNAGTPQLSQIRATRSPLLGCIYHSRSYANYGNFRRIFQRLHQMHDFGRIFELVTQICLLATILCTNLKISV